MPSPKGQAPASEAQAADARQMRVQWLGGQMGWPAKYAFLADLLAIGALIWSLLVTWRIWRRRNASSQGQG